jgi:hypothetical protein
VLTFARLLFAAVRILFASTFEQRNNKVVRGPGSLRESFEFNSDNFSE